jgi:molybdopterin-binding protein
MKLSARNVLKGKILSIHRGAVNCEVVLEIAPGVEMVSIVTVASADSLGLAVGGEAYAVIKASNVMVGVD